MYLDIVFLSRLTISAIEDVDILFLKDLCLFKREFFKVLKKKMEICSNRICDWVFCILFLVFCFLFLWIIWWDFGLQKTFGLEMIGRMAFYLWRGTTLMTMFVVKGEDNSEKLV